MYLLVKLQGREEAFGKLGGGEVYVCVCVYKHSVTHVNYLRYLPRHRKLERYTYMHTLHTYMRVCVYKKCFRFQVYQLFECAVEEEYV